MNIVHQQKPDEISENDWYYYLSKSPSDLIKETAKGLKENNRYLVDDRFQKLLFSYFFETESRYFAQKELNPPIKMYRARIYREPDVIERLTNPEKYGAFQGYDSEKSGAVPSDKATPGRANPEGISYLYTASDPLTALLEARAQPGETVSVATIKLKESVFLIDLTKNTSAIEAETIEKTNWINRFVLELTLLFQAPYSVIGNYYLCQYISEYAKNWNLNGIMYRASHVQELGTPNGINFTIFDPTKCKVVSSKLYQITKMSIETDPPL